MFWEVKTSLAVCEIPIFRISSLVNSRPQELLQMLKQLNSAAVKSMLMMRQTPEQLILFQHNYPKPQKTTKLVIHF